MLTEKSGEARRGKGLEKASKIQSTGCADESIDTNIAGEDRALRIQGIISGILNRLTTW